MKIICEKCQSKYSIQDEKVAGRTLKIKCKKCGGVISVNGKSITPSSVVKSGVKPAVKPSAKPVVKPSESVLENRFADSFKKGGGNNVQKGTAGLYDAVKKSSETINRNDRDAKIWFVVIDGKSAGPVSAKDILSYKNEKRVTVDTLIWKEGMVDWVPIKSNSEITELLSTVSVIPEKIPVKPELGLFESGNKQAPSPLIGSKMGAVSENRLDSAVNTEPGVQNKKTTEHSVSTSFFESSKDEHSSSHSAADLMSSVTSIIPHHFIESHRRWKILAALGFVATSATVLTLVIIIGNSKTETIVKEKIIEKTQVVYRDRPIDDKSDVKQDGSSSSPAVAKSSNTAKKRVASSADNSSAADAAPMTADERKRQLMAQLSGADGIALKGGTSSGTSSGSGSDALSQSQMSKVVSKNRSSLQLCYERAMKSGSAPTDRDLKVTFDVAIGMSGMVKTVKLSGSGTSYTSLKTCLDSSVKKWAFPASSGNSQVQFPIVFTPAR
ncbi:MAG: zinc-ribbon domain-containing protein [Deltaproteobacteria bacterium]|nr:zinc-ribbon domain-containing protein [Deltaproteobacteria bacterium]